jgi:autotransporter-associated beta strand protein
MSNITWKRHPSSKNFNDGTNWAGGTAPAISDTAVFGISTKTSLTFSATDTQVSGLTFNKGASNYTFTLDNSHELDIVGAGIVVKGGSATFKVSFPGQIHFLNNSTAGKAHIVTGAFVGFFDSSTAGKAHIVNTHNINFEDTSSADHAKITNKSALIFQNDGNGGSAVITTTSFATTDFFDHSTPGSAQLITKSGGTVDFSVGTGPSGLHQITAGSIAGAGSYLLGSETLFVGSNNRSTTVSGAINGAGGTLIKDGTGTLKLSHAGNTYSGGTALNAGTFDVAALGAAGTASIDFSAGKQTIKIENAALNLSTHTFDTNVLTNFGISDVIDLTGLKFTKHAHATLNGTTLTVKSGAVTDTLTLVNSDLTGVFKVRDDHHGGTKVILAAPSAKAEASPALDHLAGDSLPFRNFIGLDHGKDEKSDVHLHSNQSPMDHDNLPAAIDFHLDFGGVAEFNIDAHDFANPITHDFIL